MQTLKQGATWPVGIVAKSDWEGCITEPGNRNKISGFRSKYAPNRRFPIDVAAFTVNLNLVLEHPKALFDYGAAESQEGVMFSGLSFQSAYELEPKADSCRNDMS
ncbi:unnamed protein product [Taenia asiatica]|uniref:Galactosylgalactosylxylosylprotein 3-beta-glucuronosyltransferase n=1 Tax=Taenia asiatica TaxID=60517 RepID=A0A0R3WFL9_TAEAS|nr:unnamed protein product [Taenia asiatica]